MGVPENPGTSAPPNGFPAFPNCNNIPREPLSSPNSAKLSPVQYAPYFWEPTKKLLVSTNGLY